MKKTNKPTKRPALIVGFIAGVFLLGIAIGASLPVRFPSCPEIAVTGTQGVSTMALLGDDLYLTGVKAIRCAAYPAPAASHLGF